MIPNWLNDNNNDNDNTTNNDNNNNNTHNNNNNNNNNIANIIQWRPLHGGAPPLWGEAALPPDA